MEFRTILSRERIYSPSGDSIVKEFRIDDSNGYDKLVESGKYDLYQKIQSFRESCDLHSILKRYLVTGDDAIINKVQGMYMDVTGMPKEKMDWLNALSIATDAFNRLPIDIRSKFDNDPKNFYINIGTDKFKEIFSKKDNIDDIVIKKEEVTNEQE